MEEEDANQVDLVWVPEASAFVLIAGLKLPIQEEYLVMSKNVLIAGP